MCEQITDLVNNKIYENPREMRDAGILVIDDDLDLMKEADADGLVHGYTDAVTGEPTEPFSPWDDCLCNVDTHAALNRTPGLEWRKDDYGGEPEITAWAPATP